MNMIPDATGGASSPAQQSQGRQQLATENNPSAALPLAQLLIARGFTDDAMTLLNAHLSDPGCNERLRELLLGERRNFEAMAVIHALAHAPTSPRHWVNMGIELHLAGDFAGAAASYRQALQRDAAHAPVFNHLGRALHNLGQGPQALAAFQQAVRMEPSYAEAWANLGHALRAAGSMAEACKAFETSLALAPDSRSARINLGVTLFSMDQAQAACSCFEDLLARNPLDAEVLSHSALTLHLLGDVHEARRRYEQALSLVPNLPSTHYYLGALCNELSDAAAARQALRQAIELNPADADAWAELAAVEELSNRIDEANRAVQSGLRLAPEHPLLNIEAAKIERRGGEAATGRDRLRRVDPRALPPRLQQQYFYELGNCLDRTHETEPAWRAFEQANAIAASNIRARQLDPQTFFDEIDALTKAAIEHSNGTGDTEPCGAEDDGRDLCFLVGFPRSGTTLLDTILDAHPDLVSIEEKPTFEAVIERVRTMPGGYPGAVSGLDERQKSDFRALYREAVGNYVGQGSYKIILDKLPMRGIHASFIRTLFPRARFLFVKRHPCDVVLSNFMQQYAVNIAFIHFYTIADTVRIYEAVLRLWRYLEPGLADSLCYFSYENLVARPEPELAKICDFLGIDWRVHMLDTDQRTQSRGRIHTNSYHQVAEPIYQRAVARWRRYRTHLAPYLDQLRSPAEFLGYKIDAES